MSKPSRWARRPPAWTFGSAAVGGAMFALSFCGYDQDYLAWLCFLPLLWALGHPSVRTTGQALVVGWTMGFVAHLGVYTWLVSMLRDFGYLPLPVALFTYALVCAAQSLVFGVFAAGTHWLARRANLEMSWGAPLCLVLAEWGIPALFPSYLANSQYRRIVLIQCCEIGGVLGLSFVVAQASAVAHAVCSWALGHRRRFPVVAFGVWSLLIGATLMFGYDAVHELDDTIAHADRHLRVGLVQANMGIYEKTELPEEGLRRHREQSLQAEADGAELIVWPESGYYFAIDPAKRNVKREVLGRLHTPLLFGGMRVQYGPAGEELYNSAFLTDAEGNLNGSYDKTHLLAFGEFLPLGDLLPFLYQLSPQTSHFYRGTHLNPMHFNGLKLGTLICYEDILPSFVRLAMVQKPDILINLTNDAWFGNSNEPRIHLALATFRAVEQRRFLVRATNTGISAIIDPAGRILQETPVFARANIVGEVSPMYGTTLYQKFGDWPGYVSLTVVVAAVARARWRRRRNKAEGPAVDAAGH